MSFEETASAVPDAPEGNPSHAADHRARKRARSWLRRLRRRVRPYVPALIASVFIGATTIRSILDRAGGPAVPLDDAFIHFQYARRLTEGGFFAYVAGEGYTTGATSLLWPILLAPFHALGLRDVSLIYAAWLLGTLAHAALAVEAMRITKPLAGRTAAVGAGVMCMAFGPFAWFAWSGMETIPFAWLLLRTARVGAAWGDDPRARTPAAHAQLIALGLLAPLLRPEGALASLIAAAALGLCPRGPRAASRLVALLPLAGPLIPPLVHLAFAGHAVSSTATVKWLWGNPSYPGAAFTSAVLDNLHLLTMSLLNGGDWTSIFLPEGSAAFIVAGLGATAYAARKRRVPFHAAFVLAVALGALVPCTYLSFLWNRVRYLWPFAGAWFVMLACLARMIGDLARQMRPSRMFVTPLCVGLFAGALATHLPLSVRDLAQSARAIDRQQVALARWAAENLPPSALIGVNDTGAIAYLSGRRTFDVVGLTTEGEARYWVAGAGSRFEHYEKMPRDRLPTHFIVYPHWMGCEAMLGDALHEATVLDQSILGGDTMVVYEARLDALGSGESPARAPAGATLVDAVDVSDLESEAAHGYALFGGQDQENQAVLLHAPRSEEVAEKPSGGAGGGEAPLPSLIADGGRFNRSRDRFTARLPAGARVRLVMRVASDEPVDLSVRAGGRGVGLVSIPGGPWVERTVELPGEVVTAETEIDVAARGEAQFHAFHYWFYTL